MHTCHVHLSSSMIHIYFDVTILCIVVSTSLILFSISGSLKYSCEQVYIEYAGVSLSLCTYISVAGNGHK